MSKKPTKTADAKPALKFEKNAFYEDAQGNLWQCVTGKTRKAPDGSQVIDMRPTQMGQPSGDPTEEYVDTFVKKLTTKELKEYREVAQREAEALAAAAEVTQADAMNATPTEPASPAKPAKAPKAKKPAKETTPGKMSALDAAAKVLSEAAEPMSSKDLITAMAAKGYWTSPGGQTPHATLYAAMIREISMKGATSRFQKTDKGRFALAGAPVAAPAVEATESKPEGKKGRKAKAAATETTPAS
jgi:hypothetical protein